MHNTVEGPFGFPMLETAAKALDAALQHAGQKDYQRVVFSSALSEFTPGERADVSWITTEAPDMQREVILSAGMDDSVFAKNPIVTLNHKYNLPPVGKSLWRKKVKSGVKAKTVYPPRPKTWNEPIWAPDQAFEMIQAGLLQGKSVGMVRVDSHVPTDEEMKAHPEWEKATRITTKWLMLEYACTWLPINSTALVEAVSKGIINKSFAEDFGLPTAPPPKPLAFTRLSTIQEQITKAISTIDFADIVRAKVEEGIDRYRGRI